MSQFEYKVIPTPRRPKRAKGVKGEPARFANVLTDAINEIAIDGWEFYKTETLPMDAKPGWFSKRVEMFQSVMVFRRVMVVSPVEEPATPDLVAPLSAAAVAGIEETATPALVAVDPEPDTAPVFEEAVTPDEPKNEFEFKSDDEGSETDEAEDVVSFDADNIDPLKKVVDANRSSE